MRDDFKGLSLAERKAVEAVEQLLWAHWPQCPLDGRVELVLWQPGPRERRTVGLRVAEVSFLAGNGGSSFMQGDPGCVNAILATERLLLELLVGQRWAKDYPDDLPRAKYNLLHAVFGKRVAMKVWANDLKLSWARANGVLNPTS